jgi:uncharacterized low-complexity protein
MSNTMIKTTALAGAALVASLGFANTSSASGPLFSAVDLPQGYMAMVGEGKCGEGKCGNADKDEKDGEGKCGADNDDEKDGEGKCGEGKCGSA